jgi:hypothetical protein
MIKKIVSKIKKHFKLQEDILLQGKELEWAHNFHDSIRGIEFIEKLNLNIGRWAGNYAFFYILNRILNEYKPKNILELGLGESSKFISTYLDCMLKDSTHTIIEQSLEWQQYFCGRFKLSKRSHVLTYELVQKNVKEFKVNSYANLDAIVDEKYDLYVVDGPFGSANYSRYDIISLVQNLNKDDEFIILLDDYNRKGEQETFNELLTLFKNKSISVFHKIYVGKKSVAVLTTKKYNYATSF